MLKAAVGCPQLGPQRVHRPTQKIPEQHLFPITATAYCMMEQLFSNLLLTIISVPKLMND